MSFKKLKRRDDLLKTKLYKKVSPEEQKKAYLDGVIRGSKKRLEEFLKKNDLAEYELQKKKMNNELKARFNITFEEYEGANNTND